MSSIDDIRNERLKKLERLKAYGMNPYPVSTARDYSIADIIEKFDSLEAEESLTVAGRAVSLRPQGGLVFLHLDDGTAKFQGMLREEEMGAELFNLFTENVDVGDFVELNGSLTTTKRGEKTLQAKSWKMLSKSLRPLPDQWSGFKNPEERLRRRYLDVLMNDDIRDMVERRARFWKAVREFLETRDFTAVETPVLETTAGGADAEPFVTHHNALDMDVYLRISAGELWQKKLMVAGLPRTYEIGRIFRNEGMSREHLQDYTQMEFYMAYADHNDGMEIVKELFKYTAEQAFETLNFNINGFDVDLGADWKVYDYGETIREFTGININEASLEEIVSKLDELKVDYDREGLNRVRAIDALWKDCRRKIAGPAFLVNIPVEIEPLAKRLTDNPDKVARFQVLIAGSELGKGYSELNDPVDQYERFEAQQAMREAGDSEAQMMDRDFVEALEYGMPPTCGFGMSERVFAFLSDRAVREAQIFPMVKPKQSIDEGVDTDDDVEN